MLKLPPATAADSNWRAVPVVLLIDGKPPLKSPTPLLGAAVVAAALAPMMMRQTHVVLLRSYSPGQLCGM